LIHDRPLNGLANPPCTVSRKTKPSFTAKSPDNPQVTP
jgi:hypothetical protein